MNTEKYTIEEHIHRFAIWTSARAASKSRLKNEEVASLITESKLREKVLSINNDSLLTQMDYHNWIKQIGEEMLILVKNKAYPETNKKNFKNDNFTFGIAAKIISIYIKTAVVLPSNGESNLAKIAYPPIDSILLKNINESYNKKFNTNWSKFDWLSYCEMILNLKDVFQCDLNWEIEQKWKIKSS